MSFRGIPADAISFYEELEVDNSKTFWDANRDRFRESVHEPVEALAAELANFGDFHLFRPHTDRRFHKNRPPYKTHQGAITEGEGGTGYYLHISAEGLFTAYGYHSMRRDQLERFRQAVDADTTGAEIEQLVAALPRGHQAGAIEALKTAPRGYPKDHPRIELLRRKGLMVSRQFGSPQWLHTRAAATKIREFWRSGVDISRWLDTNVGPTEEEPDDFF